MPEEDELEKQLCRKRKIIPEPSSNIVSFVVDDPIFLHYAYFTARQNLMTVDEYAEYLLRQAVKARNKYHIEVRYSNGAEHTFRDYYGCEDAVNAMTNFQYRISHKVPLEDGVTVVEATMYCREGDDESPRIYAGPAAGKKRFLAKKEAYLKKHQLAGGEKEPAEEEQE